ncbi:hypothetical protein EV191_10310 [Tamaricihabitans halophyticus]|uniref:Secreted protein n=1 Tax=Tamaricihabitans halophyticus TaxID=1262583 RepID=A0A4R2QVB0_9PSEU|nr:hypothetical protein [Tamaricihabitans halophyticus]TCP53970.1 hypothetical protein EV191_10310 [Tamaricihabitans halophyticus]
MNAATKLSAYLGTLVVVAGAAWAIGSAVGPLNVAADQNGAESGGHQTGGHGSSGKSEAGQHGAGHGAGTEVDGLASSANGLTLAPLATTLSRGADQEFAFRVLNEAGQPVTEFAVEHEKRMHLVVVRRDTANFQHVHPQMDSDGTWRVDLDLREAGSYRAFADFVPADGADSTLGVDLAVPGKFAPREYEQSRTDTVQGYDVELAGELTAGHTSTLSMTVRKDGKEVTDLQPYLGAAGHLVALRTGDLGYVHVHPDESAAGLSFEAEVPSGGMYRLFLDFKHDGKVRTAEFTVPATTEGGHR